MGYTLKVLNDVREQIAASDQVLKEAKERRALVATAAMQVEGSLESFRSGSVAHGTVNKPVTDADDGIVLDRRHHTTLGPDGEGETPNDIVDEIEDIVRPVVKKGYPKATVTQHRRGLLVEFNDPLEEEQDPSVDLVVAMNRKDAEGLWIPDLDNNEWSASHPQKHTDLFTRGSKKLRALRARVTRLAKAWNKQWDEDDRALSSFNIEALAWEYVDDEDVELDVALAGWFAYARDELEKGETEDPADVSEPIRLLKPTEAIERLGEGADLLEHALDNDDDEQIVNDDLAKVFPDYVKKSARSGKEALIAALREGNQGVGASKAGLVVGGGTPMKTTRSFGSEEDG
jgi:hypothetical protein